MYVIKINEALVSLQAGIIADGYIHYKYYYALTHTAGSLQAIPQELGKIN